MIGGDNSFGAGGYYQTPIEEALPVTMDMKKQKQLPSLALVIVIDVSGSMSATEDGVMKIRLAAEAADRGRQDPATGRSDLRDRLRQS